MPATDTLAAEVPATREAALRHALDQLADAADSLLNTVTFQQGRTPEDEDHHGHEKWAADDLRAEVAAARITLGEAS